MAKKAFVHLNGIDYQLASPLDGDQIKRLATQLTPQHELTERGPEDELGPEFGGTNGSKFWLDVLRHGQAVRLTVRLDRLWTSAAYLVDEPAGGRVDVV